MDTKFVHDTLANDFDAKVQSSFSNTVLTHPSADQAIEIPVI
jgi:hypothetical protein